MTTIYAGTSAEQIGDLCAITVDELRRAGKDMSEAEVARARAQLKAGLLMGLESPASRTERLARMVAIWGRVPELAETVGKIDAAGRDNVRDMARNLTSGAPALALYDPVQNAPDLDDIRARMLEGAMNGMVRSPVPVPEPGTPWSFTWAIRYCELQLELVPEQWDGLEAIYKERAPGVYDLGEELVEIMRRAGWGTREQALEAMIEARDTLGLGVDARVLVIDPLEGKVY